MDHSYRALGIAGVALVATAPMASAEQPGVAAQAFQYHDPHVLGTAMDLTVIATSHDAADAAAPAAVWCVNKRAKLSQPIRTRRREEREGKRE